MKKIILFLVIITCSLTFIGCDVEINYYINKKLNNYHKFVYEHNNIIDTLKIWAHTFPLGSENPKYVKDIRLVIDFPPFINLKDSTIKVVSDTIYLRNKLKLDTLNFHLGYVRFEKKKYLFSVASSSFKNYMELAFTFNYELNYGDTLTLYPNGVLKDINDIKILPDSINIIVPD